MDTLPFKSRSCYTRFYVLLREQNFSFETNLMQQFDNGHS